MNLVRSLTRFESFVGSDLHSAHLTFYKMP